MGRRNCKAVRDVDDGEDEAPYSLIHLRYGPNSANLNAIQ